LKSAMAEASRRGEGFCLWRRTLTLPAGEMENYACILRFESMEKIHDFSVSIVGQLGSAHEGASNQFIHSWRPRSHRRFSTRDEDQHDPPIPQGISYWEWPPNFG
jgi:hypothetical protein